MIYNPFLNTQNLSPLTVTGAQTITLSYSAVAENNIVFTNDGESETNPYPDRVLQLWEKPIRQSSARVALLLDGRKQPAGIGVKISSLSERTDLLGAKALVDSIWYMYLPGITPVGVPASSNPNLPGIPGSWSRPICRSSSPKTRPEAGSGPPRAGAWICD